MARQPRPEPLPAVHASRLTQIPNPFIRPRADCQSPGAGFRLKAELYLNTFVPFVPWNGLGAPVCGVGRATNLSLAPARQAASDTGH